jgi:hypothetical protein
VKKKSPTRLLPILEKDIERGILHYLSSIPMIKVWKQNTVGVFDPIRKTFRKPNSPYIIKGISDIMGIAGIAGRMIAIEVKTPARRNNLSDDQKIFLDMINLFGGIAFVATSIEDVKEVFKKEGIQC